MKNIFPKPWLTLKTYWKYSIECAIIALMISEEMDIFHKHSEDGLHFQIYAILLALLFIYRKLDELCRKGDSILKELKRGKQDESSTSREQK